MQIKFVKNIQFTKVLKAEGRMREFNFRKMSTQSDDMFSVDVSDDRGNRIIFKMQKEASAWKIQEDSVPAWVQETEEVLSNFISEALLAEH